MNKLFGLSSSSSSSSYTLLTWSVMLMLLLLLWSERKGVYEKSGGKRERALMFTTSLLN